RKDFKVQDLSLPGKLTLEESAARARLLASMDNEIRQSEKSKTVEGMDYFYQKAFDLVASTAAQKAFNLDDEPDKLRDAYGRNAAGQGALLARRLVESGGRLAAVFQGPCDSHSDTDESSRQ